MKNIAIIPARGGSKRIPNKNITPFMGKPMIQWTIEAALKSEIFEDVLVSTDSPKIAEISKDSGAICPFLRDAKDADDMISVNVATTNALIKMEEESKKEYDNVVQLMPNCPIRDEKDIKDAYNTFIETKADFLISVTKFAGVNAWWSMKIDANNNPDPLFPEKYKARSQDLDDLYAPTGAIWIAKANKLKEEKSFYGKGYKVCPINSISAVDIDTPEDLEWAIAAFKMKNEM